MEDGIVRRLNKREDSVMTLPDDEPMSNDRQRYSALRPKSITFDPQSLHHLHQ